MNRIAIERAELGYCVNCGRPSIVGRLMLTNWQHGFMVCSQCLDALREELDKLSRPVVNG